MHKLVRDVIVLISFLAAFIIVVYLLTEKMDREHRVVRISTEPRYPTVAQPSYTEGGEVPLITREVIDEYP